MPSLFSKSKSNRAHQTPDNSPGHTSPNPSVNEAAAQRYHAEAQRGVPPSQQSPEQYRQQFPQRTTSTNRLSAHLDQATQSYQQQSGPPPPSPGLEQSRRGSYQPQPHSPPAYIPEPKKQSLRSRIAAGLSGHKDDESPRQASKNGVGRRQSVRKSDGKLEQQLQDAHRQSAAPQFARHGSSPHLPTSPEQDEGHLDPFLQQTTRDTPQVPPKDVQFQPPQFVPHPQQFNRPPLDRVSTEGSYQTQGGVSQLSHSQYSPDQLQQPSPPASNQQQYQSYQPAVQQPPPPPPPGEYQAFNPQNAPSPLLQNAQLHDAQDTAHHQQSYYQYQQGQGRAQDPQQNPPYQQQQFAPPSEPQPQPHQGQDVPSQKLPELQHPQATRVPQIVQQKAPVDAQQSQQLRPPSSHRAQPSPLQPPPFTTYDAQQGKPPQPSEPPSAVSTPPQDTMAPTPQNTGRNTLRKVNDGQQPPPAPSREASLLQQPSAQGQPFGHPPVSPGLAVFDANVVPTASQGQPYRGEKGQPGQQGGDTGRATPPPRSSATDMSEEEIEKMMKEHEVLREKYQKVKRYFFEQQSQVHQLQNTLANQRLSLSRTSWDDSEYGTRFTRLDGLIAQLSFSIRKDWKTIPQFLHPVVNKTAVETGKQEMTAVGRAFVSNWLMENIFEKYFHPDLEPGFSTQLQTIVMNIRKLSPACHSLEDEDSLAAKIINWRLATLEGLADTLRAPQAAIHRQILIETLNEKLIASLQMHMNDPAPPDLNGGVPMIIELAVSIAQHVPLESREVHIEYFPPGHGIVPDFMKMETGIPALTAPILESTDDHDDRASLMSVASKLDDNASVDEYQAQQKENLQNAQTLKEDKKRGMFGFGGGSKKPTTAPASLGKRESTLGAGGSQQSLTPHPPGSSSGPKDEPPAPRVRMAVGFAVQIRGKAILFKAPVFST